MERVIGQMMLDKSLYLCIYARLCSMFIMLHPYAPIACYPTRLLQLHHDVWNLDILLILIFRSDLKDDILLVIRYGLLADVLNELTHPGYS